MHGDGTNTRNFLYVTDVARAFEFVLFKGTVSTNELDEVERPPVLGRTEEDKISEFEMTV